MNAIVLAVETSTPVASVALLRGDDLLAEDESPSEVRHDQLLLPRIEHVLKNAGVTLREVDLLAVDLGPGGFGGLRIGLATVKGLALATGLPVVGVGSLLVLASDAPRDARWVMPVLDAHRGELFAALYERCEHALLERIAPFNAPPLEARQRVRALSGEQPVFTMDVSTMPHARTLGRVAQQLWNQRGADDLASMLPIYIRDSDAKLPERPLQLSPEQE